MLRWCLCTVLLLFSLTIWANPNGERKALQLCAVCHGPVGLSMRPDSPNLAGLSADYISRQLKRYRDGDRTHALMNVVSKQLSEEDITNLSGWYSSIEIETYPAGKRKATESCAACHGLTGVSENPDVPILAGQPLFFLIDRLKKIRDGGAATHAGMEEIAKQLEDKDIENLASWYSSIRVEAYRPM